MTEDTRKPSILRSTVYGYGAGAVLFLSTLLSHVVISRWLGPVILGEYFYIVTLNAVLTTFSSMGVGLSNSTFLARRENSPGEMNSVSVICSLVLGLGAVAIFFAVRTLFPLHPVFSGIPYLPVAFVLLPLTLYTRYWSAMMIGLNRIGELSAVISLVSILWNILILAAVFAGWGIRGLFAAWVLYLVLSVVVMLVRMSRGSNRLQWNGPLLCKSLAFGLKGNLGEIATELWKRMDVFLLQHYCGLASVGYYSVALTIVDKFSQATSPVRVAVTPRISGEEFVIASRITEEATRRILALIVLLCTLFFFLAPVLIQTFYGADYTPSIEPLRLLLPGIAGVSVASMLSIFFVGQLKRPGLLSLLAWLNVALNFVLCQVLIPQYEISGAALATSITCLIGMAIFLLLYRKMTGNALGALLLIRRSDIESVLVFLKGSQGGLPGRSGRS